MDSWARMVAANDSSLASGVYGLLPSGYPKERMEGLPWSTISDEGTSDDSFIDIAMKSPDSWLRKAVEELRDAYLNPAEERFEIVQTGTPSLQSFDALLELDLKTQESLVGVIQGGSGVAPRGRTLGDYRYRGDGKEKRNLFLISGDVILAGGRQKGAWAKHGEREFVIRAITPSGGKSAIRYFSLIRQAILLVMEGQGWHRAAQHAYRTRLLAKYKLAKNESGAWPHGKITQAWHVTSLPFVKSKLSLVHLRQITIGIFKKHLPMFLESPQSRDNVVDRTGDHGVAIGNDHYGRSQACGVWSGTETADFRLASRGFQAIMHACPVDRSWPPFILQCSLLNLRTYEPLALDTARILLARHYGFEESTTTHIRNLVKNLCYQFPFLYSHQVGRLNSPLHPCTTECH